MKHLPLAGFAGLTLLMLAVAPVAAASGSGAPQVSLGQFKDKYESLLPIITIGFVLFGLAIAGKLIGSALSSMGRSAADGRGRMPAAGIIGEIVFVIALTATAIFLAYNWVMVLNTVLDVTWTVFKEPVTGKTINSILPGATATPGP